MQIHEVTLTRVDEGLLDLAKKAGSGLAQAGKGVARAIANTTVAKDLAGAVGGAVDKVGAVLNTPGGMTTGRGYGAALDQAERAQADRTLQQQTQQQAKKHTQGWITHMKASGIDPAATTARAAPGQMPADVAASAQGQKMLKALGPPQGGIQGMPSDDLKEQTGSNTVTNAFQKWSDSQLTGRVSGTREQLTMDDVRQDAAEKAKLDAILGRIAQDPNDARAVEEYFTTAMRAMQKISAEKRASSGVRRGATADAGNEILPRYMASTQLEELKLLVKNPTAAVQVKRELGIA
jgi:hypothetical protein